MKITREDIQTLSGEPIDLFYSGIKSPVTKAKYTEILRRILCESMDFMDGNFEQRVKQLVIEAKQNPEWATSVMLALANGLKERTQLPEGHKEYLNPNSVPNFFKPLKKLFDMNSVPVSWPKIHAAYPERNNNNGGRGYTRKEIQQMLKFTKGSLDRAIIYVASSSGIREGGFALLWRDLTPIYKIGDNLTVEVTESESKTATLVCAMLLVYRNTNEEYPAFITPEAYQSLMDYKTTWSRESGKTPKDNDPIFKVTGPAKVSLSPSGIRSRMYRVVKNAGVWVPVSEGKRRGEIPIMNGFRRFWNKTCKSSASRDSPLASLIKKEFMMGHTGLTKLDKNYFKTHVLELAEEYLQAVPDLTISDEERIKADNIKMQKEKSEIERQSEELSTYKKKVNQLWAAMERRNTKNRKKP